MNMTQTDLSAFETPKWVVASQWLARLLVAGVFLVAAIPKLADPAAFAQDIANYEVPYWSWNLAAGIVPALELVAALGLLWPRTQRASAVILSTLLVVFLLLIYSVIARGIDISCGCFGKQDEAAAVGWPLFWRDVGLLAALAWSALPAAWLARLNVRRSK